jgi:glutathione S-transferase
MSIKFFCFEKDPDKPSGSGYCQKLDTFFHATGFTNFTVHHTLPMSAPKGKLPYIELDYNGKTETIADSHFIVVRLISDNIVRDPDDALTPAQRADSRAWQAWTEELVYPAVVHSRWSRPANYEVMKNNLPAPSLVRPVVGAYFRRKIVNSLWGHGIARHTDSEVDQILREYIDGLEARLGQADYFHGSKPTLIDIIVYAFLVNALEEKGNPEYTKLILASERLKRYIATLTSLWFPNYESLLPVVT